MIYWVVMVIFGVVFLGFYEVGCVYELFNVFKEYNVNL